MDGIATRVAPSALGGLTHDEAARRLARSGANEIPPPPPESLLRRLLAHLREPLSVLLIAAAAVDGIGLGEWIDAGAILTIVAINTAIGVLQEGRADRALESLRRIESPSARVRRDGRTVEIPAREVVEGDLVIVEAGDRVPADLRLARTEMFQADESLLTGESVPSAKDAGAEPAADAALGDRRWMAFSGTLAARGVAEGIVTATGARTVLGGLAASLTAARPETPLQRQLRHLSVVLGAVALVVAVGVAALVLARSGLGAEGLEEAFLAGVALAVAAVPEGLATVTVVGLALGVRRMAGQNALIRRLAAVETLGSVTTLAVDKTGTLTQNRMTLEGLLTGRHEPTAPPELDHEARRAFERCAALCSEASLVPPIGDPLERALLHACRPGAVERLRASHPRLAGVPFDADRRRMTVVHEVDGEPTVLMKGAPETVLSRCTHGLTGPLSTADVDELLATAEGLASSGYRTLALAHRTIGHDRVPSPDGMDSVERDLTLVGIAALRDPVRAEAEASVRRCRDAGIRVLMVTGDHPGTAQSVASEVGLAPPDEPVVTGSVLRRRGIPDEPERHRVYARVDPEQKLSLVHALRARGEVVGMTGDGVNDAPSLRAADIGVALGESGSDVARDAGDMVITDDNLATIVGAVHEGRGVYDNIRKVVEYLVAGNLSEIGVVVFLLLAVPELGVPLLPLQLLWINLLTDGLPAIALGVDPVEPHLMRSPPRRPGTVLLHRGRLLDLSVRALLIAICAIGALFAARTLGGDSWNEARSVLFTSLVACHLTYAYAVRRPPGARGPQLVANPWLAAAVISGLALQVAVVSVGPLQSVFDTTTLDAFGWLLAGGSAVVAPLAVAASMKGMARARASGRPAP